MIIDTFQSLHSETLIFVNMLIFYRIKRPKPSFSKPFSASNHPYHDRRVKHSMKSDRPNINPQIFDNSSYPELDARDFTAGPQSLSSMTTTMDSNHLAPFKPSGPRAMHSDPSRSGSEPDSLLDLYGRPRSHVDNIAQPVTTENKESIYMDDEDPEKSRWIHRDKLALIESHEMQEAGIKLPRLLRSNSKSYSKKDHNNQQGHEQYSNGGPLQGRVLYDDETGMGQIPGPSNEHQAAQSQEGEPIFDLRTSAEIAQENYSTTVSSPVYRQQGTKSSSSRIPLPKSSPMPIPQEHIERNTPLTRTRGASGNWSTGDDDGVGYSKSRSRSHSVGSQILLDDGEPPVDAQNFSADSSNRDSPSTSPSKRLGVRSGQTPSSGARKASGGFRNISDPQKTRNASATYRSSPNQRPKSRSGLESRPATALNRPEGDPPWLATMYKPDPRLPPDQQILPTHAKRMQQEKNGAAGHPDENLNPPAEHAENRLYPSSTSPLNAEHNGKPNEIGDESGWPLRVAKGDESSDTAGIVEQHAGYTTIPKVLNTPPISQASEGVRPGLQPPKTESQEKSEKAKRTCGCCVLM